MSFTDFAGAPANQKPFSWSFSKLDQFRTCAKKYYHNQVRKDFPEGKSAHMDWGNKVHDAMANRLLHKSALPAGMEQWDHWAKWAEAPGLPDTLLMCEQKLAITSQLQLCEYFDKRVDPWFRTVADVLKVRGPVARIVDWKTGKVSQEPSDQIALTAFVVFLKYPEVQHVLAQYVWLQHNVKHEELLARADMSRIMARALPDVLSMQSKMTSGEWEPNPSGLCKRHCNVISCQYHGRGRY